MDGEHPINAIWKTIGLPGDLKSSRPESTLIMNVSQCYFTVLMKTYVGVDVWNITRNFYFHSMYYICKGMYVAYDSVAMLQRPKNFQNPFGKIWNNKFGKTFPHKIMSRHLWSMIEDDIVHWGIRKQIPLPKVEDALQWRHNGCDSVSNHQPNDCLLDRLFRRRSKKASKLPVTGLCAVNSPVTGEFLAQMASNAENVSIWWRHHAKW